MISDAGRVSFDAGELFDQISFGRFPLGYTEEKTDHKPYLRAQEAVPLEDKDEISLMGVGICAVDTADIMVHIVAAFFEEFKVVIPRKSSDRIGNELAVEGWDEGDKVVFERVADPLFEQVAIDPFSCAVSGMEFVGNKFNTADTDGGGELQVEHVGEAS